MEVVSFQDEFIFKLELIYSRLKLPETNQNYLKINQNRQIGIFSSFIEFF